MQHSSNGEKDETELPKELKNKYVTRVQGKRGLFRERSLQALGFIEKSWNNFLNVEPLERTREETLEDEKQQYLRSKGKGVLELSEKPTITLTTEIPGPSSSAAGNQAIRTGSSDSILGKGIPEGVTTEWLIERELLKQQQHIPKDQFLNGQVTVLVNPRRAFKFMCFIILLSILYLYCIIAGFTNLGTNPGCLRYISHLPIIIVVFGFLGLFSLSLLTYILLYLEAGRRTTFVDNVHKILSILVIIYFIVVSSIIFYTDAVHGCDDQDSFFFASIFWACIAFYGVFALIIFVFVLTFLRAMCRRMKYQKKEKETAHEVTYYKKSTSQHGENNGQNPRPKRRRGSTFGGSSSPGASTKLSLISQMSRSYVDNILELDKEGDGTGTQTPYFLTAPGHERSSQERSNLSPGTADSNLNANRDNIV
eukprot:Nk52_evm14s2192 gene=Nk52_evmTU14s2192